MSQPTELPSLPVVGARVISETSETPKQNYHLRANPQNALTTSPTITSLQEGEFDPHVGAKPCSPFYAHDVNNNSLEYLKNETTAKAQRCGSNDLESGTSSTPQKRSLEVHGRCQQSELWMKKRKYDCMASLTKRQRLFVKVALALFIVGAMIGIAMGITAAVGGGVWKSANVRGSFGR